MKNIIVIFIIFITGGCSISQYTMSNKMLLESEHSISAFVNLGTTKNIDILNRYGLPFKKYTFEDGRYKYHYYVRNITESKKGGFLGITIIELDVRSVSFIFNSQNILIDMIYRDNALPYLSRYDFLSSNIGLIKESEIKSKYTEINIGQKKTSILDKMDRPHFVDISRNREIWTYVAFYKDYTNFHALKMSIPGTENLCYAAYYVFIFDHDKLVDKYTAIENNLDIEKNILHK